MQVSSPNNVKIYNLSAGKALPEWLSDRKKRSLQKNDPELRQRISLIQDFSLPAVSSCLEISKDGQYIYASGVYKPVVKCYEVSQLALKFEHGLDAEVVKLKLLSEDFSKVILMQDDRHVEFHTSQGRYYRTRIPRFGRDMAYHHSSCDMYFVGASQDVYRINLEQGRFMRSLKTGASENLCCEFNPVHELFTCGTLEGHIECWDPRVKTRVGKLDCAVGTLLNDVGSGVPSVTSLKYRDALQLAVGTATGQILVYDIRSDKPLLVKDHNYGLPIKDIEFNRSQNLVLSLDPRILKIWDNDDGKPFTSIEPGVQLNDLCTIPETGMLFMANEAPKIQTYYIPALGPAPKWCSFLDNLTEELEENQGDTVYDDYKFVTHPELDNLGMSNLIGTNLLRAYMHGFFIDMRLYSKAKSLTEPFAYDQYRKKKVREKIEEERTNRVKIPDKLPKVNRDFAEKLMEQEQDTANRKKQKAAQSLLTDDRFSLMFSDQNFQVDTRAPEYRLLNPVISKMDRQKKKKKVELEEKFQQLEENEEEEGRGSDVESSEEDSSDDDRAWTQETRQEYRRLQREQWERERSERYAEEDEQDKVKMYAMKQGDTITSDPHRKAEKRQQKLAKRSLGDRLKEDENTGMTLKSGTTMGAMEMSFKLTKSAEDSKSKDEDKKHRLERKQVRRAAGHLTNARNPVPPRFWSKPR